jgi:23S rRNA (cytosine1962-C5)-methyltransferase
VHTRFLPDNLPELSVIRIYFIDFDRIPRGSDRAVLAAAAGPFAENCCDLGSCITAYKKRTTSHTTTPWIGAQTCGLLATAAAIGATLGAMRDFRPDPAALIDQQATMFGNRVRKNFDKLKKSFARQGIDCFRLYDRDIPEVRAVADWYAGHVVLAEYARTQTDSLPGWLDALADKAASALGIPRDHVHCKRRQTRPQQGPRYAKLADDGVRLQVREGPLRLWVNLDDYLDTGLFSDHRQTRSWLQSASAGRDVLNLYCYTGTFTVAAAVGGARTTTSVDASGHYLQWLRDNLQLSGVDGPQHSTERQDARVFLDLARRHGWRWDLVVCDPPSFSSPRGGSVVASDWDVQRDHRALVQQCLDCLRPQGELWFSCNHQRFAPDLGGLEVAACDEWTARSVPPDYRNRQVHRLWRLVARG